MTEFITRSYGQKEFEVIIKTDSEEHYRAAECFARRLIGHAKPQTQADRIRAMSDEEMANAVIALYNKLGSGAMNDLSDLFCDGQAGCITKSGVVRCSEMKEKSCVLRWLQSPAKEG